MSHGVRRVKTATECQAAVDGGEVVEFEIAYAYVLRSDTPIPAEFLRKRLEDDPRGALSGTRARLATAEVGLVQAAGLTRRKARLAQYSDNRFRESALFRWDCRWRSLPSKLRMYVLVQA